MAPNLKIAYKLRVTEWWCHSVTDKRSTPIVWWSSTTKSGEQTYSLNVLLRQKDSPSVKSFHLHFSVYCSQNTVCCIESKVKGSYIMCSASGILVSFLLSNQPILRPLLQVHLQWRPPSLQEEKAIPKLWKLELYGLIPHSLTVISFYDMLIQWNYASCKLGWQDTQREANP